MKRRKVKQIFQQFLIAVVIFSLICPGSLWAKKEKPGAKIIVTKEDGQVVKGELYYVEDNSSLLLISETLESITKVSINIQEIDNIKVKKKSKAKKVALILGIPALALGLLLGLNAAALEEMSGVGAVAAGLLFGGVGAGMGLLIGAEIQGFKTYQIKGESKNKISKILKKLKKRARFKD